MMAISNIGVRKHCTHQGEIHLLPMKEIRMLPERNILNLKPNAELRVYRQTSSVPFLIIIFFLLLQTDLRVSVIYTDVISGTAAIGCMGEIIKHKRLVDDMAEENE
ncbi:uncharacterized protein HKW66_Vig0218370 [Vigna angularis]|uniref:Uncharacterized protein n=1 Tax=Phaseolus angularis TaxID=3914 RepID=A0A8T0JI68_PHAAN|nr:uncharacterized protein HKW66_Vig0218370 [Vigna angularis]